MTKNKTDRKFAPGDVAWVVKKETIKHYRVWSSTVEGVEFNSHKGFQYILKVGGILDPQDVFSTYEEALAEAEKRWAFDKENSPLVAPEKSSLVLPGKMFG